MSDTKSKVRDLLDRLPDEISEQLAVVWITQPHVPTGRMAGAEAIKRLAAQVRDRGADIARRFNVRGTPTIVVIDPDGRISFRGHQLPDAWNTSDSSLSH